MKKNLQLVSGVSSVYSSQARTRKATCYDTISWHLFEKLRRDGKKYSGCSHIVMPYLGKLTCKSQQKKSEKIHVACGIDPGVKVGLQILVSCIESAFALIKFPSEAAIPV